MRDVDFDSVVPLTTTFSAGSVVGNTATVNITILDDKVLEGFHSFTAVIIDTNLIIPGASATVTIEDNDSK